MRWKLFEEKAIHPPKTNTVLTSNQPRSKNYKNGCCNKQASNNSLTTWTEMWMNPRKSEESSESKISGTTDTFLLGERYGLLVCTCSTFVIVRRTPYPNNKHNRKEFILVCVVGVHATLSLSFSLLCLVSIVVVAWKSNWRLSVGNDKKETHRVDFFFQS